MFKPLPLLVATALALSACGAADKPDASAQAAAKPLLLVSQDLLTADSRTLGQGPVISGSLQPSRRAELRAEVPGIVLQVLKDNGDAVTQGELLVRLDPTALRDQLLSAQEAERSAKVALEQAERQFQRMQSMAKQGLVATETVETAEGRRNQSQSDFASTRAHVVEARQQLEKTEVRAPFDGVVGSRAVSAGDTAQIGMQLLSVVDPATMRFEGMIAADQVGKVAPGAAVNFRVNGYPSREFSGAVERVNPIANEATRQVQVLVSIAPSEVNWVAGLYAEGRIDVVSREAIVLPESALIRDGDQNYVWQVKDGALKRLAVTLGEQDSRLGSFEIVSGLTVGDQVLRHPLGALKDGGAVQIEAAVAEGGIVAESQISAAN